jgi:putative flippase GtrA
MGIHQGLLTRSAIPGAAQFGRYLLVGAANTLLSLGTIFLLSRAAGADYRVANAAGYGVGLLSSFILNRLWTFKSHGTVAPQVLKFLLTFCVCYAAQFGLLLLMVDRLHWGPAFSQVAAMGAYTVLGYLLSRIVVYR